MTTETPRTSNGSWAEAPRSSSWGARTRPEITHRRAIAGQVSKGLRGGQLASHPQQTVPGSQSHTSHNHHSQPVMGALNDRS